MRKKSPLIIVVSFILTSLVLIWGALMWPSQFESENILYTVRPGMSAAQVAQELEAKRILRSRLLFKAYVVITGQAQTIHAGQYKLNPQMSIPELAYALNGKGEAVQWVRFTVPEGSSIKNITHILSQSKLVESHDFSTYVQHAKKNFIERYHFLVDNPTQTLEGYLFPETYQVAAGITKRQLVSAMLDQFEQRLLPLWLEYANQTPLNLHEALTLASIVEKEATVEREMPIIAGVFYNRLKKRMFLASDPTVKYAHGEPENRPVVYYKDLEIDSPYNTYNRVGLPPTPIASPGKKAFMAVLKPAQTDYLFFVSNQDGTHSFSKTFAEHHRKHMAIQRRLKN